MPVTQRKVVALKSAETEIDELPTNIVIGPYDYSIRPMDEMEVLKTGAMGFCDEGGLEIGVAVVNHDPQHQAETMVHEILHGLFGSGSLREEGRPLDEEQVVTVLSKGILQVVRDNPHIVSWFAKAYGVPRS